MTTLPILVVEDDELVRSFLTRALAGPQGDVDACATGADAEAAVARRSYAVILLDGLLPDIHGVELARRMVVQPHTSRSGICFVSGSLRRPLPMRGGLSALPKPLRVRELIEAVGLLLEWHRAGGSPAAERMAAVDLLSADLLVR